MQIYDGRNTTDTSLGVFTGARRPFTIQSSGRFMLVKRFTHIWWRGYLSNLKGVYTFKTTKDKPKILITHPVVRAAPHHFVWCSAEGYPPINISIFKNSTLLANGTGLVMTRLNETGNYSCVASNEAGNDIKDLPVTIVDCRNLCVSRGEKKNGQVENKVECRTSNSSFDIFKCLPTTTTNLNITGTMITYVPKEAFRHMVAIKSLNISENEIEVLPEDVFSDLFSLQDLYLKGNNIQNLTANIFSALASLQYLDLSQNAIRRLPPRIFTGLSQLRLLYVYLYFSLNKYDKKSLFPAVNIVLN